MTSDQVVVDAGGRLFKTTKTTLLSSGSGYFSALLGPTGAALGSLSRSEEVAATVDNRDGATGAHASSPIGDFGGLASVAITPHASRMYDRKRPRVETEGFAPTEDESPSAGTMVATSSAAHIPKEVFIDRDPGLFADVLHFMRSARLPASVRQDIARLEDLKAEALFFGLESLGHACDEALQELQTAMEDAFKPEPQPSARCCGYVVPADATVIIPVPNDKVLYIASATLAGRCRSRRYHPTDDQLKKKREKEEETGQEDTAALSGCYIECCEEYDSGDFQLEAQVGDDWICIAHIALDHFHLGIEMGLNVDFRHDIRQCLAPDSSRNRHVRVRSRGSGDWHLACWIGDLSAIPQVGNHVERSRESKRRRLERSQNALATTVAMTRTAVATHTTFLTAMMAMMVAGFESLRR